MNILNLKPGFSPLGGGTVALKRNRIFSGGEVDLKLVVDTGGPVTITTRLNQSNDVMELLMATAALRGMGVVTIHVFMPYCPYARQDRVMEEGEAFSLRVFSDIINLQGYASVTMFDAHSDVAPALIRGSRNLKAHDLVAKVLAEKQDYVLVSPDAGAFKKVQQIAVAIGYFDVPVIATKVRTHGGAIAGTTVSTTDFGGRDVYIIDDICDGGRTFIALATEIRKRNAGTINLIVSHGIFSYGEEPLRQGGIDHVYTTDSFKEIASSYITQIPLRDILAADTPS